MKLINDVNVESFFTLTSPEVIRTKLPVPEKTADNVLAGRREIQNILTGEDKRLMVIVGPCSIHDMDAAMEYAQRMKVLREEVKDKISLIMRVYFEKPRTTVGWKGLINDPLLDSSYNMEEGLRRARSLLIDINTLGLPAATEILDPITPQYIADLLSWVAIGARTTESQTHREMASGLSMPVGFKNGTDGNLTSAVNATQAAKAPQHFLGIDPAGKTAVVTTRGNRFGHIVLRGGASPNYDPVSVGKAQARLREKDLLDAVIIDCSHDNSGQKYTGQSFVFKSAVDQRLDDNDRLVGLMLESNLFEGNQKCKCNGDADNLKYGVSITDECISWETTEKLIHYAFDKLSA
ncbi:3-deoxy-7-phosphoheptulonate synthase [Desulfobacter hydrogenophilus]|uniref:Phospho-2-dehydro-3-deoxyheptonate aldolase n=1 Tax=Desulfobacter hydrogenophilus TaxID=2291 RepID=A0A328FI48_9BACT|nr:3-deoxy-7-phosphoheptulonate synthase [Desulfobacter hydrogenophilus]NDY71914.1 3-deoxy-7-phosphoheptulonate synthase [Desulfobacter hydrogenophilus]QBH11952.1 3-deoxy-7-phosphoheptulonate synthase [Desulfobacter hydrogenophilus]RAM02687.1 3-deoxy-7-phosphoheptulonate synthase [Desulfobacter hydrogenophilus]